MRHYFDGRRSNFYPLKQIQTFVMPRFYPLHCQVLMKIISRQPCVRMRQDVC